MTQKRRENGDKMEIKNGEKKMEKKDEKETIKW